MIEVLVVSTILIMGLMALTSTAMTVDSLRRSNEDRRVAANALESIITEIRRSSQQALSSGEDWAPALIETYGAGGELGAPLPVRGLESRENAVGVMRVELVTDETLTDQELGLELGLPIDLDGDGAIASTDVSESATLLPVVVTLEWTGSSGNASLRQGFLVTSF